MYWRGVSDAELVDCLEIDPHRIGDEAIGRERALAQWRKLLRSPSFIQAGIFNAHSGQKGPIVGFGASVFVTQEFAEEELRQPRPGLNRRIIESLDAGRHIVLSEKQLEEENTAGNLHIAVMYGSWLRDVLPPEAEPEVRMNLAFSFVLLNAGFRVERMITECINQPDLEYVEATRIWNIVDRFENFHAQNPGNGWNRDRGLATLSRSNVLADPGSALQPMFVHRVPMLRLGRPEQELLSAALRGLSDADTAERLHITLPAIKRRWAKLFRMVSDARPDLLPPGKDDDTRGAQKRHLVLDYVREHPEELRPYRFS